MLKLLTNGTHKQPNLLKWMSSCALVYNGSKDYTESFLF